MDRKIVQGGFGPTASNGASGASGTIGEGDGKMKESGDARRDPKPAAGWKDEGARALSLVGCAIVALGMTGLGISAAAALTGPGTSADAFARCLLWLAYVFCGSFLVALASWKEGRSERRRRGTVGGEDSDEEGF